MDAAFTAACIKKKKKRRKLSSTPGKWKSKIFTRFMCIYHLMRRAISRVGEVDLLDQKFRVERVKYQNPSSGMQTSKCRSASIPRRLLTSSRYPLDAVCASIIQSYCSGSKQPGKMVEGETSREEEERGDEKKKKTGRRSDVSVPSASRSLLPISSLEKDKIETCTALLKLHFVFLIPPI